MVVLLYIAFGLLVLYLLLRPDKRKGKPVPGPKGWPYVGLGWEITDANMYTKFSQYARRYGDIFQIKLFGNRIFVLNSSEIIKTAFGKDPYKYCMNDRHGSFYGDTFVFGGQSMAFMERAFGSVHGDLRKGFAKALRFYGEGRMDFESLVMEELNALNKRIESCQGKEFAIGEMFKHSLLNIVCILLFGRALKDNEEERVFWEVVMADDYFLGERVDVMMRTFPFLKYIPSEYRRRYEAGVHARNVLFQLINHSKATYKPEVRRGIVDCMVSEQMEPTSDEDILYTDERIMGTILETIAGGTVTTLSNLSSIFVCLMNHPEYQEKIQTELDKVIGRDRAPTLKDRTDCPMTEAVVLEAHRLLPVNPLMLPHACNDHIEFEGYDIPRNSTIIPNMFHIHHDETIWGEDHWTFRAERFLDNDGHVIPNDHPLRNK